MVIIFWMKRLLSSVFSTDVWKDERREREAASRARLRLASHVDTWNRSISLPGGGQSGRKSVCVCVEKGRLDREDDRELDKLDERTEDEERDVSDRLRGWRKVTPSLKLFTLHINIHISFYALILNPL